MKTAKTMISEYERALGVSARSPRMYARIVPRRDGEFRYEIHAAANRRRDGRLVTKKVFEVNSNGRRFRARDLVYVRNWSTAAPPPHWNVDFSEAGHTRHFARHGISDELGVWFANTVNDADFARTMPTPAMLNGFDGTSYRYCGFDWRNGIGIIPYLKLWRGHPKAELLSRAGLRTLLNEESLSVLEDVPYVARWLSRNSGLVKSRGWGIDSVLRYVARTEGTDDVRRIVAERRAKERARKAKAWAAESRLRSLERARMAKAAEEERRRAEEEARRRSERILSLYERIKSICGRHGCYEVVVPKCVGDIVAEGAAMHNCIGSLHASGDEILVFLRKDGKPFIDLSVSLDDFSVKECRRVCNAECTKGELRTAANIAKRIRGVYLDAA